MQSRKEIQYKLDELRQQYGEWTFDIPLPFDIWTRGNLQIPHTRLRRVVQVVSDLSRKPLSECRVLDLGCLDGIFSIEFAQQGATTVGVEIREANIKKAIFCRDALELNNLELRQDDVRNISVDSYGRFDAIVCSGILYHLPAGDAVDLVSQMYELVNRVVVIDTHVALTPIEKCTHNGHEYYGRSFREFPDDADQEERAKKLWASADNPTSFWFTRPSLVRILQRAGFSSVYECFLPAHVNFGRPGIEARDRCTLVAVKDIACDIVTSPCVNSVHEEWPEQSLSYEPESAVPVRADQSEDRTLLSRIVARLKKFRG